jgi:lipopolysaccharide/colanic/teichoic acid biosynthesis glycosyltransferase
MAKRYKFQKRALDLIVACVCLIVCSPIIVAIAILVLVFEARNPFFLQIRPGRYAHPILIIKFRSMNNKKDKNGHLLPDVERITKIGGFLRRTSLDEIPQLINVMLGDMSLVGPRPLLFKYLPLYDKDQARRHDVRPGITGWAQVNGRNNITWSEKFRYDIYYVENYSLAFDIKILFLTIIKVFRHEGVNQSRDRPMQPFNGVN